MKQAFHRQERQSFPSPSLRRASVGLMVSLAVLVMGVKGFSLLLNSKGFDPHGECYLWIPGLVALHVGSDTLIGLSYVAISATLLYCVYKVRSRVPFHWIFVDFGVFIVAWRNAFYGGLDRLACHLLAVGYSEIGDRACLFHH